MNEKYNDLLESIKTMPAWIIPIKIGIFKDYYLSETGNELPEGNCEELDRVFAQRINRKNDTLDTGEKLP